MSNSKEICLSSDNGLGDGDAMPSARLATLDGAGLESELTRQEANALAEFESRLDIAAGNAVMTQGAPAECLCRVVSGVVRVEAHRAGAGGDTVGFLYPGDILGFAYDGAYIFGAAAVTPVVLTCYPAGTMASLCNRLPNLERALLKVGHELAVAQDRMAILHITAAKGRMASFLAVLARRRGRAGPGGSRLWLPMSPDDLADCLALSPAAAHGALAGLEADGAIRRHASDAFVVLDAGLLDAAAARG